MSRPTRDDAAGRAYLDLQNRARREGRGTQELLTMYVVSAGWHVLGASAYLDDFILKGGMLLAAFGNRRPTVDADALARNMNSDGVEFPVDTVTTRVIRDDAPVSLHEPVYRLRNAY